MSVRFGFATATGEGAEGVDCEAPILIDLDLSLKKEGIAGEAIGVSRVVRVGLSRPYLFFNGEMRSWDEQISKLAG